MSHENAFHFTQRRDGDAIQDIIAIVEQDFRHAHQRRVQLIALQLLRELRGRHEEDLLFQAARQRHGV